MHIAHSISHIASMIKWQNIELFCDTLFRCQAKSYYQQSKLKYINEVIGFKQNIYKFFVLIIRLLAGNGKFAERIPAMNPFLLKPILQNLLTKIYLKLPYALTRIY